VVDEVADVGTTASAVWTPASTLITGWGWRGETDRLTTASEFEPEDEEESEEGKEEGKWEGKPDEDEDVEEEDEEVGVEEEVESSFLIILLDMEERDGDDDLAVGRERTDGVGDDFTDD
jgi:hypothetical protein